ncbi:cobalamin biosynthesis protein [Hippea sp. KM1]|uniref:cobalamin biosynthesis protein n=1 Tax=Hippea sp. KM1 TaxID=944481 RepID=UPI00046D7E72|nr:cobalamin biosynthesis protein [Hippea sp. KM1]
MDLICEFVFFNGIAFFVGVVLDFVFAEPPSALHPVVWIGKLISSFEDYFYRMENGLLGGTLFVLSVLGLVVILALGIMYVFVAGSFFGRLIYGVVASYLVFSSISIRSLAQHAQRVLEALEEGDLDRARKFLSFMVSRDTDDMEKEKIITSTVESVSENFVDGVLSPMVYYSAFGIVGVAVFKTVSTFDSMIGYRNERYELFGRFAARFDDVLNFIPARLSIVFIGLSCLILGFNFFETMRVFGKYRRAHPSPNSAHPMSAFAGALGLKLGGKTRYNGILINKPCMGDSSRKPETVDIERSIHLLETSSYLAFIFFSLVFVKVIVECFG